MPNSGRGKCKAWVWVRGEAGGGGTEFLVDRLSTSLGKVNGVEFIVEAVVVEKAGEGKSR